MTNPTEDADHEAMAAILDKSDRYKVLRRLTPHDGDDKPSDLPTHTGLLLDLETTGLDSRADEVIEIAMIPFAYTDEGAIVAVGAPFQQLRQPTKPIPASITALTGITDTMVAGRTIDPDEIAAAVAPADLVIAHHARFDRPFAERFHPIFIGKAWACSMTQVEWELSGFEGRKLAYLLNATGLFHDGHRALDDCHAAIELLRRPLGATGRTALAHVLEAAEKTTLRIWAVGAPYAKKDLLRARFYRWNAGEDGRPRAWFRDVDAGEADAEIAALRAEIFESDWIPVTTPITSRERFSDRI